MHWNGLQLVTIPHRRPFRMKLKKSDRADAVLEEDGGIDTV